MTLTHVDHEAVAPTSSPTGPRWWLVALGGFLAGVLVIAGLTLSRPEPRVPTPAMDTVRFELVGEGRVDFAGLWAPDGPGQVASNQPVSVAAPYTAVLTVRADPGRTASCRIYLGYSIAAQEHAGDGSSATCVVVR